MFCQGREEGAPAAPLIRMDNRARGIRLILAVFLAVSLLFGASLAAAEDNPIRVSSLSEPQAVISEQDVNITIKIYNSGQTDLEEDIILYDPNGDPVQKYAGLKAESSEAYTGVWHVTQDEIDKGKIVYYIRYTINGDDGPVQTTNSVPVTIQTEAAAPQLSATYSVSPTSAKRGQTVTFSYTLSNTGNVELRNIVISNTGVTKEQVTTASLSVGEKITVTDTITMGEEELVSQPQITYQAAGDSKTLTISDMAKKTITVAEDGLDVTLSAASLDGIYPGEEVAFTLEMKNTGNTAYTGLDVSASDGMAVASGVELAPGASYTTEFGMNIAESMAVSVSVNGTDSTGAPVSVASNELELTTQDPTRALVLDVSAQVESTTIYSEPAVLRFAVLVKNIGQTDASTLTVKEGGTTVATIASLPSGESRTLVFDLQTSIAGQFRFDVSGKDAEGNEKVYSSNVLQVVYVEPTPAPSATPAPTDVPPTPTPVPTATPKPTLGEWVASSVNPVVLYVSAGVLAVLLALIVGVSSVRASRRKKRLDGAIDTIELSPDVRDHRGKKKQNAKADKKQDEKKEEKAKRGKKADKPADPIVPTPELESEAESLPQDAKAHADQDEGHRRRAVQSVSTDETLRVVPVDQRPDFVAQGKVDDSQTRVFSRLSGQDDAKQKADAPAKPKEPQVPELPKKREMPKAQEEAKPVKSPKAATEETVRLDRVSLDEIKRREEETAGAKGKKRSEIKPMKKKKGFLFGRKKQEEEDDFIDDGDDFDDIDDDFIE